MKTTETLPKALWFATKAVCEVGYVTARTAEWSGSAGGVGVVAPSLLSCLSSNHASLFFVSTAYNKVCMYFARVAPVVWLTARDDINVTLWVRRDLPPTRPTAQKYMRVISVDLIRR